MKYRVLLTEDAAQDLEEIHDFIAAHDSPTAALRVLDGIEKAAAGLSRFPDRGSVPPELSTLGLKDYRQTFFKPYRLVYRVQGNAVYVYLIADGRRDMQALLTRRMLRPSA